MLNENENEDDRQWNKNEMRQNWRQLLQAGGPIGYCWLVKLCSKTLVTTFSININCLPPFDWRPLRYSHKTQQRPAEASNFGQPIIGQIIG